jgi:hypothetical protein
MMGISEILFPAKQLPFFQLSRQIKLCFVSLPQINNHMKKVSICLLMASMAAFSTVSPGQTKSKPSSYGAKIDANNAIEASALVKTMGNKDSLAVKVKGKVINVCQRKGCWMNVSIDNGKEMMVRFKDYGFFVPKNCAGKTVVMEGVAFKTETPVEELRHYAEDAGKSKEEIEKINEPKKNTSFEASGVLIYND